MIKHISSALLFGVLVVVLVANARGQSKHATNTSVPHIVSYTVTDTGSLDIRYSNQKTIVFTKAMRGWSQDDEPNPDTNLFSDIQVSGNRQYIGWLPLYMVCGQNYSCTPELDIYSYGYGNRSKLIGAPQGIVWEWMFVNDGKQVAVKYGFPHGQADGDYALYDVKSLRQLASFSPDTHSGVPPEWVRGFKDLGP